MRTAQDFAEQSTRPAQVSPKDSPAGNLILTIYSDGGFTYQVKLINHGKFSSLLIYFLFGINSDAGGKDTAMHNLPLHVQVANQRSVGKNRRGTTALKPMSTSLK